MKSCNTSGIVHVHALGLRNDVCAVVVRMISICSLVKAILKGNLINSMKLTPGSLMVQNLH